MKYNRIRELEEYILKQDFVSWEDLCQVFGKSKNTMRRDVGELVRNGAFEKVYGGVRALNSQRVLNSFAERSGRSSAEKVTIGALAARHVEDHDVIFIDSGTTTPNIMPHLAGRVGVTILTNNLHVIYYGAESPEMEIISLGGRLNPATNSFTSDHCSIDKLEQFNITKAFMAATGVSIEKGATNALGELAIKKTVVCRADSSFLLVDSSKFDRSSLLTYADITAFHYVVTNQPPPPRYLSFFEEHGIALEAAS